MARIALNLSNYILARIVTIDTTKFTQRKRSGKIPYCVIEFTLLLCHKSIFYVVSYLTPCKTMSAFGKQVFMCTEIMKLEKNV